jgi:hypothetical protein
MDEEHGGNIMRLRDGNCQIELADDPTYTPNSVDNIHGYSHEYILDEPSQWSSKCSVSVFPAQTSCILLASCGTRVHEHSGIAHNGKLYVVVGNQLCCLSLPNLEKRWSIRADTATCFGVYASSRSESLVVHGELEISKVSLDGRMIWSASGGDIFTGELKIYEDRIEVADFNNGQYRIDVASGKIDLVAR